MPPTIIPGWVHVPGKHCATTALSNASAFSNTPLSEPVCLGLGAGLGAYYIKIPGASPSRALYTRALNLEENFFRSLDVPFQWKTADPHPGCLPPGEMELIRRGFPILYRCDLKYLHYYNTKTSFPGHVVLAWGFDDDRKKVFLGDTHFEGLQEAPCGDFDRARHSTDTPPFVMRGEWHEFRRWDARPLPDAFRAAVRTQAADLLGASSPAAGVRGIRTMAHEITSWRDEAEDWRWCLRFAYQVIEKRGTGGGAFRRLYAGFLEEAAEHCLELSDPALARRAHEIAGKWTRLSELLKEASDARDRPDLVPARGLLEELSSLEETLFSRLAQLVGTRD
ncbi:MAG: BtrH N-terminal domain-containing protein [bacterium]